MTLPSSNYKWRPSFVYCWYGESFFLGFINNDFLLSKANLEFRFKGTLRNL